MDNYIFMIVGFCIGIFATLCYIVSNEGINTTLLFLIDKLEKGYILDWQIKNKLLEILDEN